MAKDRGLVDRSQYEKLVSTSRSKPVFTLGELTADELIEFQKKAFRAFYFRPKYILGRLRRIKSPEEFKKSFSAMLALLRQQFFRNE